MLLEIKIICASISLTTSLIVALLFIMNSKLRTPTFRLVLQLQVADALFAIASLINSEAEPYQLWQRFNDLLRDFSQFQAFLVNYSRESSIIWIALFAYNMFATIVINKEIPGLIKYYIFAILIPLMLSIYPFFADAYGLDYALCWIRPDKIGFCIVNYLALCICTLFYIIIIYVKTYRFLNQVAGMRSYKLLLYPLTFFLTQIWTMIDIFYRNQNNITILRCFALGIVELSGFFNSLVYGLTPQVMDILKQLFNRGHNKTEVQIDMSQTYDSSRTPSMMLPGLEYRTESEMSNNNYELNKQISMQTMNKEL